MRVIPFTRVRDSKNFVRFEERDSQLIAGRTVYVDKAFTTEVGATSEVAVIVATKEELDALIRTCAAEPVKPAAKSKKS